MKEDLHNGHLRMCSDQAVELSALLAQAEFGDYNQNTAQYWYSELCGEEPSVATIDRYHTGRHKAVKKQSSRQQDICKVQTLTRKSLLITKLL